MEPTFFTPQEVADILKLEVGTVYGYVRSGRLRAVRIGNRYRIEKRDLDAFLQARIVAPAPPTPPTRT